MPALRQIALTDVNLVAFGDAGHYFLRCAAILALERIGGDAAAVALKEIPGTTRAGVVPWRLKDYASIARFGY